MGLFEHFGDGDVRALIEAYPLAWVAAGAAGALDASLLPLIGQFGPDGRLVELIGHCSRSNPLVRALQTDPRATILFKGPDCYVSPEQAGVRNWAPTWNYAQLTIRADIKIDDSLTKMSLGLLIEAMEKGRPEPWHAEELGLRYHGMLTRIIGFRATVTSLSGVFKLGQDETESVLASILDSLPDTATTNWMRRFNRGRA